LRCLFHSLHILIAVECPRFDLTAAQQAKEQKQYCILGGQTRLRLRPSAKLLVDALERVRRAECLPLRPGKRNGGTAVARIAPVAGAAPIPPAPSPQSAAASARSSRRGAHPRRDHPADSRRLRTPAGGPAST